jgi:predicted enzyme related to lactoylglutathione lyase
MNVKSARTRADSRARTPSGVSWPRMQVIFAVADLARSVSVYERAFGWPRNEGINHANYVELLPPSGGPLGLYERDGYAQLVGAKPVEIPEESVSPAYLYVRVEDVEVRRIEEAGGRPLGELALRSWGETAAWFADPDGNVVAVAQSAAVPSAH